jgi:hypothetical protein
MLRKLLLCLVATATVMTTASTATALDNDLVLSRFAEFDPQEYGDCTNACGTVVPNRPLFESLVTEMGQVLAPRLVSPAETLGEAGFAFNMATSFSFVDENAEHWVEAVQDNNPEPVFFTGHLQIRKGLPFSFEVAGNMSYLFASEMFTLGADLKWAINEGFYYFPDLAFRGTVNTLMGSRDLNLYTAGGDISLSKAFGIAGTVVITPYVGYQMLFVIGSSRLLNAYPQDPRPPQFDNDTPAGPGSTTFSPEFVFSQYNTNVNRFFVGTRVNIWILNFVAEGVFGQIPQVSIAGGVDF